METGIFISPAVIDITRKKVICLYILLYLNEKGEL